MPSPQSFFIPVMGTGHSIDTPIRLAHFGIDSVVSIVDDLLVERIRKHYCEKFNFPYKKITRKTKDGRAMRITAYLNTVQEIVQEQFEQVKKQSFFENSDKQKYFELLPDTSALKSTYKQLLKSTGKLQEELKDKLDSMMKPGAIDVNIMAKVDKTQYNRSGKPMSNAFSDGNAALRGFAMSDLSSSLILSAGFNPRLYNYLGEFKDFYRDTTGKVKKQIILKVSDFRSALIQGRYLAKKGLEVAEYRIESGLNCGGHAFPSDGFLLPSILKEFREKRDQLKEAIQPMIEKYYAQEKSGFSNDWEINTPKLVVQGGIGTHGESQRFLNNFGMDATGWGSPFLLVPEATAVDQATRNLIRNAGEKELYLSEVSPLGVPFNNVRRSGSHKWHQEQIDSGNPGSPCPKGFLEANTEFTEQPICTASTKYQILKIKQINQSDSPEADKEKRREKVLEKACLCDHLGNGALIELGILKEQKAPQAICPGPNLAWFNGEYSLQEMVDHIHGRGQSLVSAQRPHVFANEIKLYVDYFEKRINLKPTSPKDLKYLEKFKKNMEDGMAYCLEIAREKPYDNENLSSIPPMVAEQYSRLNGLHKSYKLTLSSVV